MKNEIQPVIRDFYSKMARRRWGNKNLNFDYAALVQRIELLSDLNRNEKIKKLVSEGYFIVDIARYFSISRQRAHQIGKDYFSMDKEKREKVLARDGRKCSSCGRKKNLEVHHIDSNRRNNSMDNLITFCRKHHQEIENELRDFLKEKSLKNR